MPTCGPPVILPPALKRWGGRGNVATLPTCRPLLILSPALRRWGSPRRRGLCSHHAHLWATSDFVPPLKRWRPPRQHGLCSHLAHLWATSDLSPDLKRWGSPRRQGSCCHLAHLWATSDFVLGSQMVGIPHAVGGYVATVPTCWPLVILPPAVKRWGSLRRQGLCSHLAHLWATCDSATRSEALGTPWAAGFI